MNAKALKALNAFVCTCALLTALADRVTGTMPSPLLVASAGKAALIAPDGTAVWEQEKCGNIHRVWHKGEWVYWSNGDLYRTHIITKKTELVYKPAPKEGVYGFEILDNGNIVVAENANDLIVELSPDAKKKLVEIKVNPRNAKGVMPDLHHHMRMVRKTAAGTYLVACSISRFVREYDKTGKLVWEQETPALAFDCLRRANGNTLVSHLGAVTEYTPDHQVAWRFSCTNAPELKLGNLCGLEERKNGNLVIGTYANGVEDGSRTTAFEVTRNKKIVWSYAAAGKRRSMMTAFLVPGWRWPIKWMPVTAADDAKMAELTAKAALVPAKQTRKALVVTRAYGYGHWEAMSYGDRALELAAQRGAFAVDFTNDVTVLANAAVLAKYDAVLLNNATGIAAKRFPGMCEALTAYVKAGHGLCLIHSAVDAFYDEPAIQEMNGGLFFGHPWGAGGTWSFRNEEPAHPLMAAFAQSGNPFKARDEIYMHASPPYARDRVRVLCSLDCNDEATRKSGERWMTLANVKDRFPLRADGDFAVSWVKAYGAGRVFYTSFGHDRGAFLDEARLGHVLAGLQYCLGDLAAPDAPRP